MQVGTSKIKKNVLKYKISLFTITRCNSHVGIAIRVVFE